MRKLDVSACHELKNGDEHEPAEANTSPDFDWFHFHQVEHRITELLQDIGLRDDEVAAHINRMFG